jgi:Domain of unknown function (DUF4270)
MKTNSFSLRSFLWAIALMLVAYNCTKPSDFGSELLDDQQVALDADTLPVICTVERESDMPTFDSLSQATYFLVGQLNNPDFGRSTASVFTQYLPASTKFPYLKDSTRFDSIFLVMEYVPGAVYGDTTQAQTITVHELNADIIPTSGYTASSNIATGNEVGRLEGFLPRPRSAKSVFDTAATAVKYAHVKIRLSDAFGQALFAGDSALIAGVEQNPTLFISKFKGLKITATSESQPGAVLAFDINDASRTYIRLYYTEKDTIKKFFNYQFNSTLSERYPIKFAQFKHERDGAPSEATIGQSNPDLLYLQGMGGYRLKVEFPTAAAYNNIVVNKAELVLTRVAPTGPTPVTPPAIIVSRIREDNQLVFTPDILFSQSRDGGNSFLLAGGIPLREATPQGIVERYRIILSSHFQSIVDNTSNEADKRTVYFSINPSVMVNNKSVVTNFLDELPGINARQGVFYGPNHTQFPAQLVLKYTKL